MLWLLCGLKKENKAQWVLRGIAKLPNIADFFLSFFFSLCFRAKVTVGNILWWISDVFATNVALRHKLEICLIVTILSRDICHQVYHRFKNKNKKQNNPRLPAWTLFADWMRAKCIMGCNNTSSLDGFKAWIWILGLDPCRQRKGRCVYVLLFRSELLVPAE